MWIISAEIFIRGGGHLVCGPFVQLARWIHIWFTWTWPYIRMKRNYIPESIVSWHRSTNNLSNLLSNLLFMCTLNLNTRRNTTLLYLLFGLFWFLMLKRFREICSISDWYFSWANLLSLINQNKAQGFGRTRPVWTFSRNQFPLMSYCHTLWKFRLINMYILYDVTSFSISFLLSMLICIFDILLIELFYWCRIRKVTRCTLV